MLLAWYSLCSWGAATRLLESGALAAGAAFGLLENQFRRELANVPARSLRLLQKDVGCSVRAELK